MDSGPTETTRLLSAVGEGDQAAAEKLLPILYSELRRLAGARLSRLPPGQTMQATALVHEAYLRLVGDSDPGWNGKAHFFGAAAQAMRDILVEQARRKGRIKHGSGKKPGSLDDQTPDLLQIAVDPEEILSLDAAIRRMKEEYPRASEVVMYRYFAGLDSEQTAEVLGISSRTVERDWRFARAWLRRAIEIEGGRSRMSATRAERVEELFAQGVELKPNARAAFLESRCGTDNELRVEVEALLASDESQSIEFLASPVVAHEVLPSGSIIVGKYRSLQVIGEGGMGVVHLAEQLRPVRRRVAIKVLKLGMDTRQVIARFEAERQALAMMDHPSIARVLDAGATDAGRPFFVMELVRGVAITRYCDEQRLTTRERIELFLPVVDAIQHAHHKGVIHRDIKPGNIIVTLDSGRAVAKVIDFGVAKATSQPLTEKTLFTAHGQLIGTPEYMSPEQAGMSELDVDTRSDVYSLGAVLYELLTGSKPFGVSTAGLLGIQRQICEVDPIRPSSRVTRMQRIEPVDSPGQVAVPQTGTADVARLHGTDESTLSRELRRDLDWVIACAMEKDRTRRYETAAALGADLRRFLANEPVEAHSPSAAYRVRKFASRNRAGVTGGVLVLVVLVAGIAATATLAISESRQRDRAVTALAAEKVAKEQSIRQEELANAAALDADQATARAEAINVFLEAMITSARTQSARGRDVTMREVLDATTARLDAGELSDLPLVEEEVRVIIGKTYLDLGLPQRAADVLHWSYAYSLQIRGELADETLEALDIYADAVKEQVGNQSLAIELHQKLHDLSTQTRGENHPLTLLALDGLANCLMRDGRPAEAIPLHQIARRGLSAHYGKDDPLAILPLFNIGGCQRLLRDYENAEMTYREVIAAFDRVGVGISNIRARVELANGVLYPMGKEAEGIALLRNAIELGEEALGSEHGEVISGRLNLAGILWRRGDPEGRPLFTAGVESRKHVFGAESPEYATALLHLGRHLMDVDSDLRAARQALEPAFEIFSLQRDVARDVAGCASRLSLICLLAREYDKADMYALAFTQAAVESLGAESEQVLVGYQRHALALVGLGRADEAEPILRDMLVQTQALHGDNDAKTGRALWSLGRCLDQLGEDEEAESLLIRGCKMHATAYPNSPEVALGMGYLRDFLVRRGRSADEMSQLLGP